VKTRPADARNWKHGYADTPIYKVWQMMRDRCENPESSNYENYGGRGIKVCERWQSFLTFLADMGERPSDAHSIEREDNDGNYEPGNCVWATRDQQNNNSRNCHTLTHDGMIDTLTGWAKRLGCKAALLINRVHKGWSTAEVLAPPFVMTRPKRKSPLYQWHGESLSILELSRKTGVPRTVIAYRLSVGWSLDHALTAPRRGH
jgi:hypothetical protein